MTYRLEDLDEHAYRRALDDYIESLDGDFFAEMFEQDARENGLLFDQEGALIDEEESA